MPGYCKALVAPSSGALLSGSGGGAVAQDVESTDYANQAVFIR